MHRSPYINTCVHAVCLLQVGAWRGSTCIAACYHNPHVQAVVIDDWYVICNCVAANRLVCCWHVPAKAAPEVTNELSVLQLGASVSAVLHDTGTYVLYSSVQAWDRASLIGYAALPAA